MIVVGSSTNKCFYYNGSGLTIFSSQGLQSDKDCRQFKMKKNVRVPIVDIPNDLYSNYLLYSYSTIDKEVAA